MKDDMRYAQVQTFYEDLGTLAMEKGCVIEVISILNYVCLYKCFTHCSISTFFPQCHSLSGQYPWSGMPCSRAGTSSHTNWWYCHYCRPTDSDRGVHINTCQSNYCYKHYQQSDTALWTVSALSTPCIVLYCTCFSILFFNLPCLPPPPLPPPSLLLLP